MHATVGYESAALGSGLASLMQVPASGGAAPAAPAAGGTSSSGSAPASGAGGPLGSMGGILMPILIFVAFYFFLIRPQQQKQKELESKLKVGDRVVTNSGLIGTLTKIGERRIELEIAKNVKITMLRSSVTGVDEGDAPAKADGDKVAEAKK
jgi:preprotein translocase subunit YajC